MVLSLDQLILRAREQLNKITGLKLSTTLGVTRHNGTWVVSVELVEKHSIPDGMDILATYEVNMDEEGTLVDFKRKRLRKRIDTEDAEA
ncbi:MAG: hypothetical protein A3G93_01075 [Nitrospinae bacterium RIFCSPLOWO2_12_FULL_45_22]|nr:MAG: hypothetical protein A3G93_01075 [Nitrospinae bacterium RIFCSPLOWO2_12_FULL_45_22]